jgi:hypothetical protein
VSVFLAVVVGTSIVISAVAATGVALALYDILRGRK